MIVPIRSSRKWLLLGALALALAGCGGDDEEPRATGEPTTESTPTTESQAEPQPDTTVDPETETLPPNGDGTGAPEGGPGGAGDEEPARTLALFTGRDGRITPRVIRVPAFISIRVELRSGDGAEYGLSFGEKTLGVRAGLASVSTTFEGLRPGAKLVGTPAGGGARVRVEATAEPGP